MPVISSISHRTVLNSHVEFTPEFVVEFADGSVGQGASPQGETISIYEDRRSAATPASIVRTIADEGFLGKEISQATFDEYLQARIPAFGRNNAFALSLAFFTAGGRTRPAFDLFGLSPRKLEPPRLALNILNGGRFAYTNPVLSDFSEFLLVAKSRDLAEVVPEHNAVQRLVAQRQLRQAKAVAAGHLVNAFAALDNRAVLDFLMDVVRGLGLADRYELMIDASAGDLWTGEGYRLGLTDGAAFSSEAFVDYWSNLVRDYGLRYLEDPFHEKDFEAWRALTSSAPSCVIVGDNLYSSDEGRIREGAARGTANGAVIKPNQAGTVTAVVRALQAAKETGHFTITSHRSISTESTFLSLLSCLFGADAVKIGPLASDFTSVARLNEIIRLTEDRDAC